MKSLSELRLVLGGLQDQVNECVQYIDQLSGMMWGGKTPRKKYAKKVNGEAPQLPTNLREKVKAHFQAHRSAAQRGAIVSSPPNSPNITIEEAARILHMSDNGVRFRIKKGELPATTETRQTRTAGVGARPHKVMVVNRAAVAALAHGEGGSDDVRVAPARKPKGPKVSKIQQQRQRTLDYLALFDTNDPRRQPGTAKQSRMLGPLVRRGYIKEKGEDGYVRTDREFSLKPPHKSSGRKKR